MILGSMPMATWLPASSRQLPVQDAAGCGVRRELRGVEKADGFRRDRDRHRDGHRGRRNVGGGMPDDARAGQRRIDAVSGHGHRDGVHSPGLRVQAHRGRGHDQRVGSGLPAEQRGKRLLQQHRVGDAVLAGGRMHPRRQSRDGRERRALQRHGNGGGGHRGLGGVRHAAGDDEVFSGGQRAGLQRGSGDRERRRGARHVHGGQGGSGEGEPDGGHRQCEKRGEQPHGHGPTRRIRSVSMHQILGRGRWDVAGGAPDRLPPPERRPLLDGP